MIARPHIANIINKVQSAEPDTMTSDAMPEILCTAEVEDVFECLGEDCTVCFVDIMLDMANDLTCKSLEIESFCASVEECVVSSYCDADCTNPALALENCSAENYLEEFATEPDCPDLCQDIPSDDVVYVNEVYNQESADDFIDGETDDDDHDDVSSQTLRGSSSTLSYSQLESVFQDIVNDVSSHNECANAGSEEGCPAGKYCQWDGGRNACNGKKDTGSSCSKNLVCQSNNCSKSSRCNQCPSAGSRTGCADGKYCKWGGTNNRCVGLKPRRGACNSGSVCESGKCKFGFCTKP